MAEYKRIGILGGMGPEATAELYLRIIRIFQEEYGATYDSDFPEMIILNLPLPDVVGSFGEESVVRDMLVRGVKKLESAGSDFIAVPCNTVSFFISDMRKAVSIPIIDIVEETACRVHAEGLKKVGLLGTRTTVRNNLYQDTVGPNVEVICLNQSVDEETTRIILRVLGGKKQERDKLSLDRFVHDLKSLGAEKVILGCTELSLLLETRVDTIDTLQILARAVVERTLN